MINTADHKFQVALVSYLRQFLTETRLNRFDEVISERTRHLCVVLEDIYQAHNASAVLRSCDCFGIQDVYFIENKNRFKISEDVAMGSSQWLSIYRKNEKENNSRECILELKNKGYRIVATTPHEKSKTLKDLDVTQKTALVFGTEIDGISEDIVELADEFVRIPMYGFTESFNISVSAALCMYELSAAIRQSVNDYQLSKIEQTKIYLDWLRASIHRCDLIEKEFEKKWSDQNSPASI